MRTLVVNDDGVDSAGIGVLARVARDAGLEVVVAAPSSDSSGSSAALTRLEEHGRLVVDHREYPDLPGVEVMAVESSPAMIVFLSASGAFGARPDLVLSGINHGPNTGQAVLHSGTVGAAFTGANQGVLAAALSMDAAVPEHWATAEVVARSAIDWLIASGVNGTVLNINIPDVPPASCRGIRCASLAAFGAVQAVVEETSSSHLAVAFTGVRASESDTTDAGLLQQGWATATVLRAPAEATDVDVDGLSPG
ncbi:5'/3'-nucleotidase SurE [Rhodococcus sp. NPDC003322]